MCHSPPCTRSKAWTTYNQLCASGCRDATPLGHSEIFGSPYPSPLLWKNPLPQSVFSLLPYWLLSNCSVCLIGKGIMRSGMLTVLEQWAGITIKITIYQHTPMLALQIQKGASISVWFIHGGWWSSTRRRLFSGTVHFWTPWKAKEEQQEQCGVCLRAQIIRELSRSRVMVLVTHTWHCFPLQTIHRFLHDNWSTGKVHTKARCKI